MTREPPEAIGPHGSAEWLPPPEEIEQRAVRGVALMLGRTVGVQAFTFIGTIVLSRLLSPVDYGNFAIALTFQIVGRFITDLGLSAALIRRREAMTPVEEQTVTGISLAGSVAVSALLSVLAFVVLPILGAASEIVRVVAVTSLALPLYSARAVPVIRLERLLDYKRLTWIESVDPIVFYAFAIPAALAGLGPYALAGAIVCAAAVGSAVANVVRPWYFGARIDRDCIRPILAFSLRASALAPLYLIREFLVLVALAAIGGPAQAGFYNLAQRLFSLNQSIAFAVQRVTQTAFARDEGGGTRDRRGVQTTIVTTLGAALPLAAIVGTAHLSVDILFGTRWHPTATLVIAAAGGWLLISGPISVMTSLALSHGDATAPMRAMALQGAIAVLLTAGLVPWLGILGAGLAVTAGAIGSVAVMLAAAAREIRSLLAPVLRIAAATVIAIALGSALGGAGPWALAGGLVACSAAWLAIAWLLLPGELRLLARLLSRNLSRSRRPAAT